MTTEAEVTAARERYEASVASYHQERSTVVRLRGAPDEYRGDLSCLVFLDRVEVGPGVGDGCPTEHPVMKNGVLVGTLSVWYGSGGRGKLAAEKFEPAPGVTVEWD